VHIQKALELCQGTRLRARQILGIGRTSLHRYLKRDAEDPGPTKVEAPLLHSLPLVLRATRLCKCSGRHTNRAAELKWTSRDEGRR
jgi:hypothetical protein